MGPEVDQKFTGESKLEAVRLIKERGVSYAQAHPAITSLGHDEDEHSQNQGTR
jgi:hypothetical protein